MLWSCTVQLTDSGCKGVASITCWCVDVPRSAIGKGLAVDEKIASAVVRTIEWDAEHKKANARRERLAKLADGAAVSPRELDRICGDLDPEGGLAPAPPEPKGKIVVLEHRGGADKGENGHRPGTIELCNALIATARIRLRFTVAPSHARQPRRRLASAHRRAARCKVLIINA